MQKKIHGVIRSPNTPGRVMSIRSRKNKNNNKIRLDKLINSPRPRILVKRSLGGSGDVIMSLPLLKHIKRILPHCELTYMTDLKYQDGGLGDIILHNPYVDILLGNGQANESEYDYSVDITTTGLDKEKAGIVPPNRIDLFAEEAGIDVSSDPQPDYIVTPQEKDEAKEYIKSELNIKNRDDVNLIMIQCRSNDARRTWPLENVDRLADLLVEKDLKNIVLLMDWGSSVNKWNSRKNVFAIKNLHWTKTAALMEKCDLVICPDSSLLHMAGALNKKTITIFGPIPPESRINHYPNATAVKVNLRCMPCFYQPSCVDRNKLECLKLVTPEMVLDAVDKKMKEDIKSLKNITYGKDISKGNQDNLILVSRQFGGLGDILMCTPGIKALSLKYPNKKIHFAIPKQYIEAVKHLDFIDQVFDINSPINKNIYYMIMDVSSPCAKYEYARISMGKQVEKSRIEIFSEALGVRNLLDNYTPYYKVIEDEKIWAKEMMKSFNLDPKKKTIAFHPKSAEVYRDYNHSNVDPLVNKLMEIYNVILLGHERNVFVPGIIDLCNYPIRKWAAILSLCDGLISVDTGPLHLAAALNIPTIGLFGPIDYKARCKGYKHITVIKSNLKCIPCWRNANIKCKQNDMVRAPSKCMDIPPETIIKVAKQKFKGV